MRLPSIAVPLLAATQVFALGSTNPNEPDFISPVARDILAHVSRDLAGDIWNDIKHAASCAGCQSIFGILKGLLLLGNGPFVSVITAVCKDAKIYNDAVCEGAVALEGPVIANAIRSVSIGSNSANLLCIELFGLCSYPAQSTTQISFPNPKPATTRLTPSGKQPIQIVAMSDIHIDQEYTPGSATQCGYPMCCRPYNSTLAPGGSGTVNGAAGPNGDHNCDSHISLETAMYSAINTLVPNAEFILFNGDIVDHAVWDTTQGKTVADINDAYDRMASMKKNVYGVVGNHESSPINSFQTIAEGNGNAWVWATLGENWAPWIGSANTSASVQTFGAYAVNHENTNLVIISINTNLWFTQNYYLYEKQMEMDPSGQLAWLVQQLDAAEQAGKRVYIIGHSPPGGSDIFRDQSGYFDQIVNRYQNTIAASIFGHTHHDEFQLSYSNYASQTFDTAVAMHYVIPAMVPTSGMPAFRVFDVDPDTWLVLDSTTYMADMNDPAYQTTGPVFTKYYSAAEVYGPMVNPPLTPGAELSPAFWHNLTESFANNADDYNTYVQHKSRGWNAGSCTGACTTADICGIRAANAQYNCANPKFGIHFKREEAIASAGHNECGLSVTASVFGQLQNSRDVLEMVVSRAQSTTYAASLEFLP